MSSPSHHWSNSNLRRRSFRGQDLTGANFQGADLRGSDFSQATLVGANFAEARIGVCPLAWCRAALILLGVGVFGLQTLSQMIFGVLGMTPDDPNFSARVILIGFLGLGGGLVAMAESRSSTIAHRVSYARVLLAIAALLQGLLMGAFWGGVLLGRSLWSIGLTGMVTALLFCLGWLWQERQGFGILVFTLGTVFTNGLFFFSGVNALQRLAVQQWGYGLCWSLVAGLYFLATLRTLSSLYQQFQQSTSTTFAGADLSQVKWDTQEAK